jgi:hypothetical protein
LTGQSFLIFRLSDSIKLGCDVEEPVIKALQSAPSFFVSELAPIHLQEMTGGSAAGNWEARMWIPR